MERLAKHPDRASARPSASLLVLALAATAVYVWAMNVMDLPVVLVLLVAGGVALGLAIGRWWIVLASLGTWTFPIFDSAPDEALLREYVVVFYMPLAALSIAVGVLIRKFASTVSGNRPRAL